MAFQLALQQDGSKAERDVALVDLGAQANLISRSTIQEYKLTSHHGSKLKIRIADGSVRSTRGRVQLTILKGNYRQ